MYDRIKLVVGPNADKSLIVLFADAFERLSATEKQNTMSVKQA